MRGTRHRSLLFGLTAMVLAAICSQVLAAPRVALVIGNASYAHAPALANPLNDMADVGAAFGRLGFEVTRIENADRASLWRGLQEFALAASASEIAVVFYAGHGIEVDHRNFLVPVDARLASDQDVEFEAVPLELVQRAVERASKLRLVILDACRENPFAVSMQRAGATRSIGRGLGRTEPAGETLVAYAAKEGTLAADGAGRNSPYSEALLAHVEEPGLEVGLMFRRVRDAVLASTGGRQEPFVYGSISSRETYLAAARPASEPAPLAGGPAPVIVPGAAQVAAEQLAAERVFWESVKGSTDPAELHGYLERYPGGTFEVLARSRLQRLEGDLVQPEPPAPAAASASAPGPSLDAARIEVEHLAVEREFWASVKASTDPAELQAYLDRYPDGTYAVLARSRLKRMQAAATPPAPEAASDDRVNMLAYLEQSEPLVPATPYQQEQSSLAHRIPEPSSLPIPAGDHYGHPSAGSFTGHDASRYVGAYVDHNPHGFGTYTWADGDSYKGDFRRGKMHGRGTYTFPDGRVWSCEWRKNAIVTGSCEHDLFAARTWKAKDRMWNIELKMSGDYVDASIYNPVASLPLKCRGEVSDAGEIDAWCRGEGWTPRKLVGTFPNLKLRNPSSGYGVAGGASFAFELDKERQRIN